MFRSLIAGCVLGCITVLALGFSSAGVSASSAARPASSHQGSSSQALGLKTLTRQNRFSNEPVQIMGVWVNGQSIRLRNKPARFNEANDWLRGLVVRFKNVSDKPVSAVEFHLVVAEPGYSTTLVTFTLKYGRTLSSSSSSSTELLMPGATAEVALSESWYDQAKQSLDQKPGSSISMADRADLGLSYVCFSDRTAWQAGSLRQSN